MEAAQKKDEPWKSTFSDYDYSNFYYGAGDDPLNLLGPFAELVPGGAAERLLPLLGAALERAPDPRPRARTARPGSCSDLHQHGVLQLPGHLVPARGEGGRDRGHREVRSRRVGLADPLGHLRRPRGARRGASPRFKDKEAAILFPTGYSANVGFISAHHARGRHHPPRPVLARLDRGRRHPGEVEHRLLPPQQPARPRAQARRASRARSWWWWRASTRWTATSASCPRSSRWRSATARAS